MSRRESKVLPPGFGIGSDPAWADPKLRAWWRRAADAGAGDWMTTRNYPEAVAAWRAGANPRSWGRARAAERAAEIEGSPIALRSNTGFNALYDYPKTLDWHVKHYDDPGQPGYDNPNRAIIADRVNHRKIGETAREPMGAPYHGTEYYTKWSDGVITNTTTGPTGRDTVFVVPNPAQFESRERPRWRGTFNAMNPYQPPGDDQPSYADDVAGITAVDVGVMAVTAAVGAVGVHMLGRYGAIGIGLFGLALGAGSFVYYEKSRSMVGPQLPEPFGSYPATAVGVGLAFGAVGMGAWNAWGPGKPKMEPWPDIPPGQVHPTNPNP